MEVHKTDQLWKWCELNTMKKQNLKDIKNWTKLNKIIKGKNVTCFLFATNLRQSRAFRMQFVFSGWGLCPHTTSRGFAPAPSTPSLFQIYSSPAKIITDVTSNNFLAHQSRRLQWAIVIAHRPSSVRPSVRHKMFTFSTSSPEPCDGFWWNLVGMKYSWSLTSVVVFRPDPPRGRSRAGPK